MDRIRLFAPAALAAALAGCASTPPSNANLDLARSNYTQSSRDPNISSLAPAELKQASDALQAANEAWLGRSDTAKVDGLAYIAKQRVELAREVAKRKQAEQQIADAGRQRDQILASRRNTEVEQARNSAAQAGNAAEQAQARARQLEQELQALQAKQTERGAIVTLGNLMFDVGSAQLNPGGTRQLREVATVLQENPNRTVMVEGFTDSTGSAELNRQLSEQRAESIRNALVGMGVSPERISTRGYGEQFPVADNHTSYGRQINRRVEIIISNESGRIAPRTATSSTS